MATILAKIKSKQNYRIILSATDDIFDLHEHISAHHEIEYTPNYILEQDEWFVLNNFTETPYCIEFVKRVFLLADYTSLPTDDYIDVKHLCIIQNDDNDYIFQNVQASQIIRNNIINFSGQPSMINSSKMIVLGNQIDAVYKKDVDKLYFKKLAKISSIFNKINEVYKVATDAEVRTFLTSDFIQQSLSYQVCNVSVPNRRNIALAKDLLEQMQPNERDTIFSNLTIYYPDMRLDNGKFSINSDDDLKRLLHGIGERYYTTSRNEKRLANSVLPI